MSKPSTFITIADTKTATWGHVEQQLNEDLAAARSHLESPTISHDLSNIQRGRIAALKELLAYAKQRSPAADPGRPRARQDIVDAADASDI